MAERHHINSGHMPEHASGHLPGHLQKDKASLRMPSIIIRLILFAALVIVVFYISYFYIINDSNKKYEASLKSSINDIISINKSLNILSTDKTLITDKSKITNQLTKIIENMEKSKRQVSSLIPTEKYFDTQNQLETGLQNNIEIFRQLNALLVNSDSSDIETSLASLKKYLDQCNASYNEVSKGVFQLSLPQNVTDTTTAAGNYINTIIKLQAGQNILKTQNSKFVSDIASVYNQFSSIKVDFSNTAASARNGSQTYDSVLDYITKTSSLLQSVRDAFSNITVTTSDSDAKAVHSTLKKLLNEYDTYIQSFSYALTNEKVMAQNGPISSNSALSLYSKSVSNYNILTDDNSLFIQQYNNFKIKINPSK